MLVPVVWHIVATPIRSAWLTTGSVNQHGNDAICRRAMLACPQNPGKLIDGLRLPVGLAESQCDHLFVLSIVRNVASIGCSCDPSQLLLFLKASFEMLR